MNDILVHVTIFIWSFCAGVLLMGWWVRRDIRQGGERR